MTWIVWTGSVAVRPWRHFMPARTASSYSRYCPPWKSWTTSTSGTGSQQFINIFLPSLTSNLLIFVLFYNRENMLRRFTETIHLENCTNLKVLVLIGNPICESERYKYAQPLISLSFLLVGLTGWRFETTGQRCWPLALPLSAWTRAICWNWKLLRGDIVEVDGRMGRFPRSIMTLPSVRWRMLGREVKLKVKVLRTTGNPRSFLKLSRIWQRKTKISFQKFRTLITECTSTRKITSLGQNHSSKLQILLFFLFLSSSHFYTRSIIKLISETQWGHGGDVRSLGIILHLKGKRKGDLAGGTSWREASIPRNLFRDIIIKVTRDADESLSPECIWVVVVRRKLGWSALFFQVMRCNLPFIIRVWKALDGSLDLSSESVRRKYGYLSDLGGEEIQEIRMGR